MKTITFNPQNWIDETLTATIADRSITVHGETLVMSDEVVDRNEDGEDRFDFHTIKVMWDDEHFTTLIRFGGDDEWCCTRSGIERQHSDPATLVAIMAANLI